MRFLTSDIERAGRDAGPHHVWWRRASAPAIFTCMNAHWHERSISTIRALSFPSETVTRS